MLTCVEEKELITVSPTPVGRSHHQQTDGSPDSLESVPQAKTFWSAVDPAPQPRRKYGQQRVPLPAFRQPSIRSEVGVLAAALNSLEASRSGQTSSLDNLPTPNRGIDETAPGSRLDSALPRSEIAMESVASAIIAAEPSFACAEPVIEAAHDLACQDDAGQHDTRQDAPNTSPDPAAQNRRAFPRHNSECQVAVYRNGQGPSNSRTGEFQVEFGQAGLQTVAGELRGLLLDVSMNGAAILLSEPMEAGEEVFVRLSNQRFGRHIDASVTVVRSTAIDNGRWKTVCQFRRNLTFEQVYEFGKQQFDSPFV